MKTAMQELKDKIQTAIGDFTGELTNYNAGWKQCLITIQNQIDDELLEKEKEQIINAGNACALKHHIWQERVNKMDLKALENLDENTTHGEDYYNETYKNK